MEDICIVCLINTSNFVIGKCCECKYCYNCVFDWLEQNPEKLLKQSFNCLNYHCNKPILFKEYLSSIDDQKMLDRYNDIAFKNYLKSSQDIRSCPNKKCKSYGFLPSSRCSEFLECETCNYKWYDKKCLSLTKLCVLFLKNMKNDFLCFFQEFYYTHQCPNCDIQIMKNGGCNHMTCKSCNHEYCYICRDKHVGHDSKLCALKENSFFVVIAYLFIQLFFTCEIHTFLIYLTKCLFYLGCTIFTFINALNGKLIVICAISTILDMKYLYDIWKRNQAKLYRSETDEKKKKLLILEITALLVLDIIVILTTYYEDNIIKIDPIAYYIIYPVEFIIMLFICFWYK